MNAKAAGRDEIVSACGLSLVVETGVDPVTPRFSGVCSAD